MIFRIVQDRFGYPAAVFGQLAAAFAHGNARCHHVQIIGGVQQLHNGQAQNVVRRFQPEKRAGRHIDLLHTKLLVQNKNGVRRIVDDLAGEAFGLFLQKRQAHGKIGLALINGDGLIAAGGISAAAAVQLVLGRCFAHFGKDLADGRFARNPFVRAEIGHDACALAGVHFDKAMMQSAGFDLADGGDTVLHAVYGKICKIRVFGVHAFDDAALDGKKAPALAGARIRLPALGGHARFIHPGL